METDRSGVFLGSWLSGFVVLIGFVVMAGCSSSVSRVQTWEGEVANPGQSAVLSAPSSINVKAVNGRAMTNFLVDDLALDYELLPGNNEIVFTYKTIWAKTGVVENGESKVHVVETPRQSVSLQARAGESYRFDIEKPDNREQAAARVKDFSAPVISASGRVVATSTRWTPAEVARPVARAPVPDSRPAEVGSNNPSANALEQLKSLWVDASEEEKREFLRWAFE